MELSATVVSNSSDGLLDGCLIDFATTQLGYPNGSSMCILYRE